MMTRPSWAWALLWLTVSACQCRPGPVDPVELGLRVLPTELDFGRVLEGDVKTATLTLTTTTRSAVTVQLSAGAPFSVSPSSVDIPGGSDVSVEVAFRAGNGVARDFVTLTVGDRMALVPVQGFGVRPPACVPSAECIVSVYSLEEDRCIESQAADDSACDPASVCLEQGRCRSGQCLGVARTCDDDDACTDDACAMGVGCIHTTHACPGPTALCQVATCDSQAGCGFGPAADLTACGAIDCVEANFCFQGMCRRQPTPEGYPCSPAVACLPEATCQNQECTRVQQADWAPEWSAPLSARPTGALASAGATLFFSVCADPTDAGPLDAGLDDAGLSDSGVDDAGLDDAGLLDGGAEDAGVSDGGVGDAGLPFVCGLTSYTGTGFERFTRAYDDGQRREVLAVNQAGVVVWADGGLEVRATNNGLVREARAFSGTRQQVAIARDAIYLVHGDALIEWLDGGSRTLANTEPSAQLARGSALFSWDSDAGVLRRFALLEDGGVDAVSANVGVGLPSSLAVVGDDAVLGAAGRATLVGDGGFVWAPYDFSDAGALSVFDDWTLSSALASDVLIERCDGGCSRDLVSTSMGSLRWSAWVSVPWAPVDVVGATLIDNNRLGDDAVVVVRSAGDAGTSAEARLYLQGVVNSICHLPNVGTLEQVHFSSGAMVTVWKREDGGAVLESYNLGPLPISRSGWPQVNGVGGTRSDR